MYTQENTDKGNKEHLLLCDIIYAYLPISHPTTSRLENLPGQPVTPQLCIFLYDSHVVLHSADGLELTGSRYPHDRLLFVVFVYFAAASNGAMTDHSTPCP